MSAPPIPVEDLLGLAIRHVNAGQRDRARLLCAEAQTLHPPHPAVLQLLAVLALQDGDPALAARHAEASLALRPDHPPTLVLAGTAQQQCGLWPAALLNLTRATGLQPKHADAWFTLALARQDGADLNGAAQALRRVLALAPQRADAALNLGIVLQDLGLTDEALQAYGCAYRLLPGSFGRIAHALAAAPQGKLWLDLDALRSALAASPA